MSPFQIIGVLVGFSAGIVWEKLATDRFGHFRTLFPSMLIKDGAATFHLHHWLLYLISVIVILFFAYKTGRLTHPAILFVVSGLIGAILFDIFSFRDWLELVQKK